MMDPLLEITIDQLEEYIRCPNRFYIRYVNGIVSKQHQTPRNLAEKQRDHMLYALMDGQIPDIDGILENFTRDCLDHKYPIIHKDVQKASSQLIALHNWLIGNRVQVADLGTPFELTFPSINVILKGTFGTIRYNQDKLELLEIDFSNKEPDQDLVNMSIRYTIQTYAVHKLIKKYDLSGIRVLSVKRNRVEELLSYRSPVDYTRLENTVTNVAKAIRHSIFYPRESFECGYCPVRTYCSGILEYIKIGADPHAD